MPQSPEPEKPPSGAGAVMSVWSVLMLFAMVAMIMNR